MAHHRHACRWEWRLFEIPALINKGPSWRHQISSQQVISLHNSQYFTNKNHGSPTQVRKNHIVHPFQVSRKEKMVRNFLCRNSRLSGIFPYTFNLDVLRLEEAFDLVLGAVQAIEATKRPRKKCWKRRFLNCETTTSVPLFQFQHTSIQKKNGGQQNWTLDSSHVHLQNLHLLLRPSNHHQATCEVVVPARPGWSLGKPEADFQRNRFLCVQTRDSVTCTPGVHRWVSNHHLSFNMV